MSEVTKPLTDLTPAQRAALFQQLQQRRRQEVPPQPRIERQPRTTNRFPLSFAQQRIWFLDQFEPNNPQYNIPQAFRIRGALDGEVLERVLHEIVRRHEALRTTFDSENGSAVQVISARAPLVMHTIDLRDQPDFEREAVAREIMSEDARRAFELARGPFLRVRLMQLADEDHILFINMHHIVSDVWSYGVLFRELTILYRAFSEGRSSPLTELPIQYVDFAQWQRATLQGDVLNRQIDYWKRQLVNTPPLELPTDRPRPAVRLEYLGRVDQQVKVRGYRIELGEIEGALAAVPGVRQAVVVAQAEGMGSQRLVAYLVVEPGADTRAAALRTLLKARLPEYMIPAVFVTLDRLPLTPNGKVDRRSLPAPDALDAAPEPDAVGPRSPLEAQLLDLWQAVLGRPVHSVHDNFFALGGHSLMATQVMARVRSRFDVEVSLRTLFEAPTVAGLAEAIVEQELAQADPALLAELVNSL